MTAQSKITTFSLPPNSNINDLVTAFNAFFAALQVNIVSVTLFRPESPVAGDSLRMRVGYIESTGAGTIGLKYEALSYETTSAATAAAQFNALYVGTAYLVPQFFFDLSSKRDVLFVIAVVTDRLLAEGQAMLGSKDAVYIAEPNALIASGAAGACDIFDARGNQVGDDILVRNVDPNNDWPADQRNYCIWDQTSGELLGLPTCQAVPAPPAAAAVPADPPLGQPCPSRSVTTKEIIMPVGL